MSAITWVVSNPGRPLPPNAVVGGHDAEGHKIYVGRAHVGGERVPCNIIPEKAIAYVSHANSEHKVTNFEVMCQQKLHWIRNFGGNVPHGAVEIGQALNGEKLYVGKIALEDSVILGKVHPSHSCLYVPYEGREHSYKDYDILVIDGDID